jgi:hypothetical protein
MELKKQGEIALAILKEKFRKDRRLPDVETFKRDLGNVSKKIGFSKEELTEFMILLVNELTEEFISELKKVK